MGTAYGCLQVRSILVRSNIRAAKGTAISLLSGGQPSGRYGSKFKYASELQNLMLTWVIHQKPTRGRIGGAIAASGGSSWGGGGGG